MKVRHLATVAIAAIASIVLSGFTPALAQDLTSTDTTTTGAPTPVPVDPTPTPVVTTAPIPSASPTPAPSPAETSTPTSPAPPLGFDQYAAPWTTNPLSLTPIDVIIQVPANGLGALKSTLASFGMTPEFTYTKALIGVALSATSVQINALKAAVPGLIVSEQVQYTVADVQPSAPWNLSMLDQATYPADSSYTYSSSAGSGVKVYVIDTGVNPNPQLGSRLLAGADFTRSGTSEDCNGHGTHVAGTIAASTYGVAKLAKIVPLHALAPITTLGCGTEGSTADVIAAIDWAINDNPVDTRAVINMSIGALGTDSAMNLAVTRALSDGIVVVVAAGNNGDGTQAPDGSFQSREACGYSPANSPGTLTVGAVNGSATEAGFSNYGPCVDIFAPGVNIVSLNYANVNGTATMSGTSMATPHVAGAVALYISEHPADSVTTIKNSILGAAKPDVVTFASGHSGSYNRMLNITAFTHPTLTKSGSIAVTPSLGTPDGRPRAGGTLTASGLTWTADVGTPTVEYSWYSCLSVQEITPTVLPADCTQLSNENQRTLAVTTSLAGQHILSGETATAAATIETAYSTTTGPVGVAPVVTADPVISGVREVGEIFSVTNGVWDGYSAPTFTYQWFACSDTVPFASNTLDTTKCSAIAGETDPTFTVASAQRAKRIMAAVFADNDSVSTPVARYTASTDTVITQSPTNTALPTVRVTANAGSNSAPMYVAGGTSSTLTAANGTWVAEPAVIGYGYAWSSCDSSLAGGVLTTGCTPIIGATALSYTVTASDVGRYLLVTVTARAENHTGTANSATSVIVGQKPVNNVAPALTVTPQRTGDSPTRVGDTVDLNDGEWAGSPNFSRVWYACTSPVVTATDSLSAGCSVIAGATGTSFVLASVQMGKYIVAEIRATNSVWVSPAVTKFSASTTRVDSAPVNTAAPSLTLTNPGANGAPRYSVTLSSSTLRVLSKGTWSPVIPEVLTGGYTYQWYRCASALTTTAVRVLTTVPDSCVVIGGATADSYALTADDVSSFVSVAVTATNTAGSATRFSPTTVAVTAPPVNTAAPTLSSVEPLVGNKVSLSDGTWTGSPTPTFARQWFSCSSEHISASSTLPSGCVPITGATGSTFTFSSTLLGKFLLARVTASNASVTALEAPAVFTATTADAVLVAPTLALASAGANSAPTVSSATSTSTLLTIATNGWTTGGTPAYAYSWFACETQKDAAKAAPADCGAAIAGETDPTFRVTAAQAGKFIVAAVTLTSDINAPTRAAASTGAVTQRPQVNPLPTLGTEPAYVGRTIQLATEGTWTGTPAPTLTYKWFSCTAAVVAASLTQPTGCTAIAGATAASFTIASAQANLFVIGAVYGWNGSVAEPGVGAFTASTPKVLVEPTNSTPVKVTASKTAGVGLAPVAGATLTATAGIWTGTATISYSYQWFTCSAPVTTNAIETPDTCVAISGATLKTLVAAADRAGEYLTVAETATNPTGSKTRFALATASVVTVPSRSTDPSVGGVASINEELTVTDGQVSATPTAAMTYAWFACSSATVASATMPLGCVAIPNQSAATYTLDRARAGSYIVAKVVSTNVAGSNTRFTASTAAVKAAPAVTTNPSLTVSSPAADGSLHLGGSVSISNGVWSAVPAATYTREWFRCDTTVATATATLPADCTSVSGADAAVTYTPTTVDLGTFITARVTATNELGSASVVSASTKSVTEIPTMDEAPTLSSNRVVGQTITLAAGAWHGTPVEMQQQITWYRCPVAVNSISSTMPIGCVTLTDSTTDTRALVLADVSKFVVARVRMSNAAGATTVFTASSASIATLPSSSLFPIVNGNRWVGEKLTATAVTFSATPTATLSYAWYSCTARHSANEPTMPADCSAIPGATTSTLAVPELADGTFIMHEVTGSNVAGATSKRSETTDKSVKHIPSLTQAPSVSGNAFVATGSLQADPGSWDGTAPISFAYQWYYCSSTKVSPSTTLPAGCAAVTGAKLQNFTPQLAQAGKFMIVGVTATNATKPVTAFSSSSRVVSTAPVYVSGMAVSVPSPATTGAPRAGFVVRAVPGTWTSTPVPAYTYQWYLCSSVHTTSSDVLPVDCDLETGATSADFMMTPDMARLFPLVRITGTTDVTSDTAFSRTSTLSVTVPPAETATPSVSGNPYVFGTLTADKGTWTGVPATVESYAWYACTTAVTVATTSIPAGCAPIAYQAKSTLKLAALQKDKFVSVRVTSKNVAGSKSLLSVSTAVVTTGAVNTVAPVVTVSPAGQPKVTGSVSVNRGTWVGTPAPVAADDLYQWYRCENAVTAPALTVPEGCFVIEGATESTYVLDEFDKDQFMVASVTAHNDNGDGMVVTKSSTRVNIIASNDVLPEITGRPFATQTLTATEGVWSGIPDPTFLYQWQACASSTTQQPDRRDCVDIPKANQATFVPGDDQIDKYIVVHVIARNVAGDGHAWSVSTEAIKSGPVVKVAPAVTVVDGTSAGLPLVGGSLETTGGTWLGRPTPTLEFQWMRCATAVAAASPTAPAETVGCVDIDGARTASYSLTPDDRGKFLLVRVTGSNTPDTEVVTATHWSASSAAVTMAPVMTTAPEVGGVLFMEGNARAKADTWAAYPDVARTYEWLYCTNPVASDSDVAPDVASDCVTESGATSSMYVIPVEREGKHLVVKVTASNNAGTASRWSASSVAIVAGPVATADPLLRPDKLRLGTGSLSVTDGTWRPAETVTIGYQWYRCAVATTASADELDLSLGCAAIDGALDSVYTPGLDDAGKAIIAGVTGTNILGTSTKFTKSTTLVTEAPSVIVDPSLTGVAAVNNFITLDKGTWRGFPTPTYVRKWYACSAQQLLPSATLPAGCTQIGGATGERFKLTNSQLNRFILSSVRASNSIDAVPYSSERFTVSTARVSAAIPSLAAKPVLANPSRPSDQNPLVDNTITLTASWSPAGVAASYGWQRCDAIVTEASFITTQPAGCVTISGATSASYKLTADDTGKFVIGMATGTNGAGVTTHWTNSTREVGQAPTATTLPAVPVGDRVQGQQLTADPGIWSGLPVPVPAFQWYTCSAPVLVTTVVRTTQPVPAACALKAGEVSSTYTQTADDAGKYVTVQVSARTTAGERSYLVAVTAELGTAIAPRAQNAPAVGIVGNTLNYEVGITLTERDSSWISVPSPTLTYQWFACESDITASPVTAALVEAAGCVAVADSPGAPSKDKTYLVSGADLSKYMLVSVTASNLAAPDGITQYSGTSNKIESDYVNTTPASVSIADGVTEISADHPQVVISVTPGVWEDPDGNPIPTLGTPYAVSGEWYACKQPIQSVLADFPLTLDCAYVAGNETAITLERFTPFAGRYITYFEFVTKNSQEQRFRLAKSTGRILEAPSLWTGMTKYVDPTVPSAPVVGSATLASGGNWATNMAETPADPTTWRGSEKGSLAYRWFTCTTSHPTLTTTALPADCDLVSSSSSSNSYTPIHTAIQDDSGKYLGVQITATNSVGSATVWTATSVFPVAEAPSNRVAPSVGGTAIVDEQLTIADGQWWGFPAPSFVRAWYYCSSPVLNDSAALPLGCSLITGATGTSLTLKPEHAGRYIVVKVTGTTLVSPNNSKSATRFSASSSKVLERPVSTLPPVLSGNANVGSNLSMTDGTWRATETATRTYQWFECDAAPIANSNEIDVAAGCAPIPGKTANILPLTAAQTGKFIVGQVKATNSATSASGPTGPRYRATAASLAVKVAPTNVIAPSLSAEDTLDQTITADRGTWDGFPSPSYAYQWYSCTYEVYAPAATPPTGAGCVKILNAVSATFKLTTAQVGKHVLVEVRAYNALNGASGDAYKISMSNGPIRQAPVMTVAPTITGILHTGETVNVARGTWLGSPTPALSHEWFVCAATVDVPAGSATITGCDPIASAANGSLVLDSTYAGKRVVALVTATNSVGSVKKSSSTSLVVSQTPSNTVDPEVTGATVVASTNSVSTTRGTWDSVPSALTYTYAWYTCTVQTIAGPTQPTGCSVITGQIGATLTLTSAMAGKYVVSKVTAKAAVNKAGAGESSQFSSGFGPIRTTPSTTSTPTISGSVVEDQTLTATVGSWTGYPSPTTTYAWFSCPSAVTVSTPVAVAPAGCTEIAEAADSALTLTSALVGKKLLLLVTATNSAGATKKSSISTAVVAAAPVVVQSR